MKRITTLSCLLFFVTTIFATGLYTTSGDRNHLRFAHKKGQKLFHGGVGVVGLQYPNGFDYILYGKVTVPERSLPIGAQVEYAITNDFGVGLFFNSWKARVEVEDVTDPDNKNGFDYKSTTIALRGTYHIYTGKNMIWLDPYTATTLGFHAMKDIPFGDNNLFEPEKGGFAWGLHFGANMYFFQNLGIFAEVGYGVNLINGGLTLRF